MTFEVGNRRRMSNMTFADDFEEWSTELKETGNGIKNLRYLLR